MCAFECTHNNVCCWDFFVQLLRHVWVFVTPKTAGHQASLSFIASWSLLKFISTDHMSVSLSICMYFIVCQRMYIYNWRDILCNVQVCSFTMYIDVYIWVIVITMYVKKWISSGCMYVKLYIPARTNNYLHEVYILVWRRALWGRGHHTCGKKNVTCHFSKKRILLIIKPLSHWLTSGLWKVFSFLQHHFLVTGNSLHSVSLTPWIPVSGFNSC